MPSVSRLCFGSLTIGPLQAALPVALGADIIAHAVRIGVNFIDTAQYYRTYDYIREAMRITGRYDLVISSKTYAYTYDDAAAAVDEARRAIDRDYIDIFMLHEQESIDTLRGHARALDCLFELRERGVIRAVGASTHRVAGVQGLCDLRRRGVFDFDVVHPLYNKSGLGITDGSATDMGDAITQAKALGIGVFAMKALGGGNLIKSAREAFNFVLSNPNVDAVAVGMQSIDEVDANAAFFEDGEFPASAVGRLAEKRRALHIEDYCVGCGRCVERCWQHALRLEDGHAVCDTRRCLLCGYCAGACPEFAIKVI